MEQGLPAGITHEEQVELEQMRSRRSTCTWFSIVGLALVVLSAFSNAPGPIALVGIAVVVLCQVMRSKATNRMQLIQARLRDRGVIS